jgi:cobalt-zinc-cadmium efflux system outer membrane protein
LWCGNLVNPHVVVVPVQAVFGQRCQTVGVFVRSVILLCVFLASCATSFRDRAWIDRELSERIGASTRADGFSELPRRVTLEDGLDEAEVVSIALWRNPSLRAELTRIDAARATLDEAHRPANPQLSVMGPIGPITAVATLLLPLESLWQMPSRTATAAREADVIGETVLMRALDLVRDARLLHVELGLAIDRAAIRRELTQVAIEVARIAVVRARAGDISPMDERLLSADAEVNLDASEAAETEVSLARARLMAQLALDEDSVGPLHVTFSSDVITPPELPVLVAIARASRPDALAAEFAIGAATARGGWERSRVIAFGALVEGHWAGVDGPALRLGGRIELPIFGANPGGIGRADAEIERAFAQHELVARTIVLEVTAARARWVQAARSRQRFEVDVLPALDEALEMATCSFETGDDSYLIVLDALRRTGEARLRRAELVAEERRARGELDRAIGARLQSAANVAARRQTERGGS